MISRQHERFPLMAGPKYLPTLRDQKAAQSFQNRQTRQEPGLKKFAGAKATTKKAKRK